MSTSELPLNGNSAPNENDALPDEPQEHGKGFKRRIFRLLEEMFGPSPNAQVRGLIKLRKGEGVVVEQIKDEELGAAYQRGRESVFAEQEFSERVAKARSKYADFDAALRAVKPLVPRAVLTAAADLPHGLEALYALSRLPKLCEELSELPDEKAVERFGHFEHDFALMTGAQR